MYIKLNNAQKAKGITVSEKALEYLLFVMKINKMWPEIIDLSENYAKLTGTDPNIVNEIKNYYLSDALIQMPFSR
jgi:hypothetical protein